MSDKRTCGGCRFWHREDPISQHGQCRRYPPSAVMPQGLVRPTMPENNSCGEWRDKSITPQQEQRAELVTRFALAIVSSDYDDAGARFRPATIWRMAEEYVDARPKIGGES